MLENTASSPLVLPDNKRLLSVYIFYRLGMSLLLNILFLSGLGDNILGTSYPNIFMYSGVIYTGLCCLTITLYVLGNIDVKANHVLPILLVDFIALTLMIYASNEAISGLGYLLLIPMAVGSTFLRGKTSVALAAFATLLILLSSIIDSLDDITNSNTLFLAGVNGIILFITAIAFRLLSKKIQSSEYEIQQTIEHADYLQRIGQRIIETIQAGIIIIDNDLNTLFINNAAEELLSKNNKFIAISKIKSLYPILQTWQKDQATPEALMINLGVNNTIKVSFTKLPDPKVTSLMLFIEDERRLNQQAQQLKLASLGRLTSSIAHEIRNPLGAISHASQLLDESEYIEANDQELLNMIQVNSQRIDQTINNILQFSRRKRADPEIINICQWLEAFIKTYQAHNSAQIMLNTHEKNIYCKIDPNHLQQIMNNLVDNGLRHSNKEGTDNIITIETYINPNSKLPYINVIDEGNGIQVDNIDTIFEPFYTTKSTGSGLGLYLCKELCQANQADIIYLGKTKKQKSCFRLLLSQPR